MRSSSSEDRRVQRVDVLGPHEGVFDHVNRHAQFFGNAFGGRVFDAGIAQVFQEGCDAVELFHPIGRQAYHARFLRNAVEDRLPNPPVGIGNEFKTPGFIKAFGGLNKSHIASTDQIFEAQSTALIFCGNFDHEAKICGHELVASVFIPGLDSLGERYFFLGCKGF